MTTTVNSNTKECGGVSGNDDHLMSLRTSLMKHLLFFIDQEGKKAIVTRLAMALCALSVQMNWDSVVDDLLLNLQQSQQSQVGGSGGTNTQSQIHLVLEIAKLLPEEATSDRLLMQDESQRILFCQNLQQTSSKIAAFLHYCVVSLPNGGNANGNANAENNKIKELVLKCLHSWVSNVNIPPQLLQETQLLDWIFTLLQAGDVHGGETFELAVDVIIEILRCYPSNNAHHTGLVHRLIPLVMALGTGEASVFQKMIREEDEDGMRAYCRIFTEMGESYMSLIMHHEDLNQVALVDLVLACSAIPDNGEYIVIDDADDDDDDGIELIVQVYVYDI